MLVMLVSWAFSLQSWAADAHDACLRGTRTTRSWAADAHNARPWDFLGHQLVQIMRVMLVHWVSSIRVEAADALDVRPCGFCGLKAGTAEAPEP